MVVSGMGCERFSLGILAVNVFAADVTRSLTELGRRKLGMLRPWMVMPVERDV